MENGEWRMENGEIYEAFFVGGHRLRKVKYGA